LVLSFVSACGNKGDLFLVPDEITEQDLLRLEQSLETENPTKDGEDTVEEDDDEVKKDTAKNTPSS